MKRRTANRNRYHAVLLKIFFDNYIPGATAIPFVRTHLELAAKELDIDLPKNLGDVIYSVRYRSSLPEEILRTQPEGMEWIIEGTGRAKYEFRLAKINRIVPNSELVKTKIPDATPEIISAYALSDEQALLAIVRYNRLVDLFLGITSYSLQNHLRTSVSGIGQIEIDEVYVGLDTHGRQFAIPVQAKGGTDQLSVIQTKQDIACCSEKFPSLTCRPISAQFISSDLVAMFELAVCHNEIQIVNERHYKLVPASDITVTDLSMYNLR